MLSCTFEYGELTEESVDFPEITMEGLEYVRVRDGKLTAKLNAEIGERYESRHTMNLTNYKFEQYNNEALDAEGTGGTASVEMVNNNVKMSEGVSIRVDSEDLSMETMSLEWQDKTKTLKGGSKVPVQLLRSDGTEVNGTDFQADIRSRTWVFGSDVHGTYVYEDDEDEKQQKPSAANSTATVETEAEIKAQAQAEVLAETVLQTTEESQQIPLGNAD